MKTYRGSGGINPRIPNIGTRWTDWLDSRFGHFTLGVRIPSGTHWTGGWVGPRVGLEAMTERKISSYWRCWELNSSYSACIVVCIMT